jgi:formate hydrogenlyase subunit 3/multisubunit Na+/H+ antiporter MnhD subunit
MVMQVLAWMWCIIFAMSVGSITVFGISALAHALLIAGVFITAGVFTTAKRRPQYFGGLGRGNGGEHE